MNKIYQTIQASLLAIGLLSATVDGQASSGGPALPDQSWGFHGIFGRFDNAALKRGAQVATEVCLGCHSIKYIKFDQLKQIGLSEAEINALASTAGRSRKDFMLSAMDENAAKESFGIVPPDLSLITKARKGYESYVYAVLTGYLTTAESAAIDRAMEDGKLSEQEIKDLAKLLLMDAHHPEKIQEAVRRIKNNENFNKFFTGNFFAMPAPLTDEKNIQQMSKDVVSFLAWAAEPTMVDRKSTGISVMLYLVVLTVMLYAVKKRIWARIHH